MTDRNNRQFEGIATSSKGKTTTIASRKGKAPGGNLQTVKVVGLPEPTNSERARDEFIYLVLAGQKTLQKSLFIQRLWFPDIVGRSTTVNSHRLSPMELNNSQHTAMCAMVGEPPIVIVHGTFDAIFGLHLYIYLVLKAHQVREKPQRSLQPRRFGIRVTFPS